MSNKEKVEKYLKKVNWSLVDAGCDHYFLIDSKGKETKILFYGDRIQIDNEFTGTVYFCLNKCKFEYSEESHYLTLSPGRNKGAFINFYDRKK